MEFTLSPSKHVAFLIPDVSSLDPVFRIFFIGSPSSPFCNISSCFFKACFIGDSSIKFFRVVSPSTEGLLSNIRGFWPILGPFYQQLWRLLIFKALEGSVDIVLAAPAAGNPKLKVLLIGAAILETVDFGDTVLSFASEEADLFELLVAFSLLTITAATDVAFPVAILKSTVVDLFKLLKILTNGDVAVMILEPGIVSHGCIDVRAEINDEIVPLTLEVQFHNVAVLVVQDAQLIETPMFAGNDLPNVKLVSDENGAVVNFGEPASVERTILGIPDNELDPSVIYSFLFVGVLVAKFQIVDFLSLYVDEAYICNQLKINGKVKSLSKVELQELTKEDLKCNQCPLNLRTSHY
uniref:Uncharacterized protein n=1 Tax=Glossina palpalis gambiensis TaxID=67801 RepID=A0A1B0BMR5_9MUSC